MSACCSRLGGKAYWCRLNIVPAFSLPFHAPCSSPFSSSAPSSSALQSKHKEKKLWGGRFAQSTHELTDAFNASVSYDKRLALHDVRGSIAHANMLFAQNIIDEEAHGNIVDGLDAVKASIEAGDFEWRQDREDVHMNVEAKLTELIGDAGGRLHTARSRNDQVATDLRLFAREAYDDTIEALRYLRKALIELAEREHGTVLPGYTHLQRAQPVLLSHHILAYEEMFFRDTERMEQARHRCNVCPLGSAALAGASYEIDREMVARELEFSSPTRNSLDAVSDRDFIVDYHSAAAQALVHISRLSEEIILWASGEFGFVNLDDQFQRESIMPQKRNPDVCELARGKSARVAGNLMQSLMLMKSQPLAYNKDNQEVHESIQDSVDATLATLRVFAAMIPTLAFNREKMREAAVANFSLATDYADYLAKKGVPFRDAHHAVGALVAECEARDIELSDVTLEELKAIHPSFEDDALHITLESCLDARSALGGTAPAAVKEAREVARGRLGVQ